MSDARTDFANLFLDALRSARGDGSSYRYDAERFLVEVKSGDGQADLLFLANAFAEHQALPAEERPRALRKWLTVPRPSEASLDQIKASLMPRVRLRSAFSMASLQGELLAGGELQPTPHRVFGEHYAFAVCQDQEEMVMDLGAAEFERYGVSFDELADIALENLRKKTPTARFVEQEPGVHVSRWRDTYDVTRVLLPEVIASLAVKGDPLAFLVEPAFLVVTGTEDVEGIALAVKVALEGMNHPRFMAHVPLRLGAGGWTPFTPGMDHPLGFDLWKLRVTGATAAYESQRGPLTELYAKRGTPVFVNRFTAMAGEGNATLVHAAWANDGTPVLLPEVEKLILGLAPKQMCLVDFAVARQVLGEKMKPVPGIFPPRYLAESFPTTGELEAMSPKWMGG
jgi:hypothetical protein